MPSFFDAMAEFYDEAWGERVNAAGELEFLRRYAAAGPVLEVGVGTGRVAIPLAANGTRVHGIDPSPMMLDRLRAKLAGGPDTLTTGLGDMSLGGVEGPFRLIFAVYNTLFYAASRGEQQAFFERASDLLTPTGRLLVEGYVPTPEQVRYWNQGSQPVTIAPARLHVEFYQHDSADQLVRIGHHLRLGTREYYAYQEDRYLWPAQMDELARQSGLALDGRWAGWSGEAFGEASERAVSLYRHAGRRW